MFGTHNSFPIHAEPSGFAPTLIFATIVPRAGSTRKTRPVSLETQSASCDRVIQSTFASLILFVTRFVLASTRTRPPLPRFATHRAPNA